MSRFLTESETEAFLETETRLLTMPDGSKASVNGFKLMWNAFDLLQEANMFTEARLVELASALSARENVSFDTALSNLVAYAHQSVKSW